MIKINLLEFSTLPSIYQNQFKDYGLDNYACCGYYSDNECVIFIDDVEGEYNYSSYKYLTHCMVGEVRDVK